MRGLLATFAGFVVISAGCHLAGGVSDLRYDDDGDAAGAGGPVDSCNDGVQNNDEVSIDCGGSCKTCNGTDCSSHDECKSGFCDEGTCRACLEQNECRDEDYCDEPTGICKPEEPEGATCLANSYCQDHLWCDPSTNTCAQPQPEGSVCTAQRECQDGLYCAGSNGVGNCVPQKGDGESCWYNIECLSGDCHDDFDVCVGG